MEKLLVWVVLLCTTIHWVVQEKLLRPRRRLSPGPTPLPVIGNLHSLLDGKPHKALAELARIHGPLMFIRLGFKKTVVVSSAEVAREVLRKNDAKLSDRTVLDSFWAQGVADYSMSMLPVGPRWRTLRKVAHTLMVSNKMVYANELTRMEKINDLVSHIRTCSQEATAVNIGEIIFDTNLNILSNIMFSMDVVYQNSEFSREFKEVVWCILKDLGRSNLANSFPILKRFDIQGIRRLMETHFVKVLSILDGIIQKRLVLRNNGVAQCDDMLDALLNICHDKSEDFEVQQIKFLFLDFFIGGTESISSTTQWAMAELLREPHRLEAAQEELNRVIGKGNFVKEADLTRLPYLKAILNETLRLHPILPFLLPRKANLEVEILGFQIPKDSQLLVNIWAIGRDPCVWKNPDKFEPERFFDSEVDAKGNHFELLPFGSGRRVCVGLPLAMKAMPLLLGNLINLFEWRLEKGMEAQDMNMEDIFGTNLTKLTPLSAIPTPSTK